ncbi:MAG: carboxypeptidase-like regulatory domain-containing protein [Ferruginibacter sp.]|nr:carboxypeptidase-like regulatory domain-containing protein [Ferruginibacter sp.]
MKKTFLLLLFSCSVSFIIAQVGSHSITGKVVDAVTKNPMQAASVFAQNTTMGTATDATGNFTLWVPNGGYDLVITFTGYETITRRVSTSDAADKNLIIELKQQEKAMEDVVVKASNEVKDGWEKYGSFFLENFIGKTENSKQCSISNHEVLKFYYYKKRNRLKVLASAPVEINNLALGYKIIYTLDSFVHEYGTETGVYTGYPMFQEMTPTDSIQANTWQASRKKAYSGSILHFMRSIYNKSLKEEGFEIQFLGKNQDRETAIKLADFYTALNYTRDDSLMTADISPNQPDLAVLFSKETPDAGYLSQNDDAPKDFELSLVKIAANESIGIEQNGYYFDQNDLSLSGYWGWTKVADMVPYDYIPR